jgi:hypothetical protein
MPPFFAHRSVALALLAFDAQRSAIAAAGREPSGALLALLGLDPAGTLSTLQAPGIPH